jgi:arylsulfatase A-like enzyme
LHGSQFGIPWRISVAPGGEWQLRPHELLASYHFAMSSTARPNIIFIVADDLGYADLGCYGGRDAAFGKVSPHIDALAAGGRKFAQGYSHSPVCSPTRFALMTGRCHYRQRGELEEPINSRSKGSTTLGLPPAHPTLPSLLRESGYRTTLVGKWHLSYPQSGRPTAKWVRRVFDPMAGGVDYFTHGSKAGEADRYEGEQPIRAEGYLTDLRSRRGLNTLRRYAAGAAPFS